MKKSYKLLARLALVMSVLLVLYLPVMPAVADNPFYITVIVCAGGSVTPSGEVPVNAGDNITFTFTPDPVKHVQEVWVNLDPVTISENNTYTFENVQSSYSLAVSFAPYELRLVAGTKTVTLTTEQFQALPQYGATPVPDKNAFWQGVPLYILINQVYPGNSTNYTVNAVCFDPDDNISFSNSADYPFLDPVKKELFIVADQFSEDGSTWIPVPPRSSGGGARAWAPLRMYGERQNGDLGSAFHHFGSGLLELQITDLLPWITAQPANSNVLAGNTATFSATAGGAPAPVIRWQVSTDGGSIWSDISGEPIIH
jgi:hypothetical protein